MEFAKDITELVGATPLVRINRVAGDQATVLAKVEMTNPGGSVKDRICLAIIRAAEAAGQLRPGGTIVEATSGNTGVGLAMLGAALDYQVVIAMPESMSAERRALMRAYGAELILTPAATGMAGAVAAAESYVESHPGAILARQFANPQNPAVHYQTTGREILDATGPGIGAFVAGVGTGGTISGVGRALKELNPQVRVVAVEPAESPLLTSGTAGPHKIQGIGANFIPENLDRQLLDEVLCVPGEQALEMARRAATQEGLLVGISAGAALVGAANLAARPEFARQVIVTVLPDTGERYLSTDLYRDLMD